MHYYNERLVEGMISDGGFPKPCSIRIRLSRDVETPDMTNGATLSLSDDETVMLLVSDKGIRAILDMFAESSPENGFEWGF